MMSEGNFIFFNHVRSYLPRKKEKHVLTQMMARRESGGGGGGGIPNIP